MERPKGIIEPVKDEHDHELSQTQANIIALADVIFEQRPEDHPFTFVDVMLSGDMHEILRELEQIKIGELLAAPTDQLAMKSDGSHYPILDLRKENLKLEAVTARVWSWNHDKVRFTDRNQEKLTLPRKYKLFPGETDAARQVDIVASYHSADSGYIQETIGVYTTSSSPNYYHVASNIWASAYAETGYEGHMHKDGDGIGAEDIEDFLSFIAQRIED